MYNPDRRLNYLNIFDLKEYTLTASWNDMFVPLSTERGACVATDTENIYVIGGRDPSNFQYHNALQIYSISTETWSPTAPSMRYQRYNPACIGTVNSRSLYVK